MKNSYLDPIQAQRIERIKELLEIPTEQRTEKMCLELMSFTKDFKLFENISMSIEHQNVCSTMTLKKYKPNEVIVKQDDPGDSFFYILHGTVNIRLTKSVDTGIKDEKTNENVQVKVEKNMGVLKDGDTFGELALLYGTPRSATIIAVTNSSLIKIDKAPFDRYVKNVFENQLQDQIEFLKICPVFHKMDKDSLIKLGIRTEIKKFSTGQPILESDNKTDMIYIIRRGTVKVIKEINFVKNDKKIRKEKSIKSNKAQFYDFDEVSNRQQIENDIMIEILSRGPSELDMKINNFVTKQITLETLKIGDIFPSYYAINSIYLDVEFQADNPCELIVIKLNDIQEIIPETYDFIKKYAKPYPGEEFLRKFYYYNEAWNKYKNALKFNIMADCVNRSSIKSNDMRSKIYNRKDLDSVKLPTIFGNKNAKFK